MDYPVPSLVILVSAILVLKVTDRQTHTQMSLNALFPRLVIDGSKRV